MTSSPVVIAATMKHSATVSQNLILDSLKNELPFGSRCFHYSVISINDSVHALIFRSFSCTDSEIQGETQFPKLIMVSLFTVHRSSLFSFNFMVFVFVDMVGRVQWQQFVNLT